MTKVKGTDDFGDFRLTTGHCGYCGMPGIIVRYDPGHFKLPFNLDIQNTIFRPKGNKNAKHPASLGVTCGDYAKGHRQVAHVTDRLERIAA